MNAAARPLFYTKGMPRSVLESYVFGAVQPAAVDTVEFPAEAGGDQERQLALPYLPGMDEVTVSAAELAFCVGDMTLDVTSHPTAPAPDGAGVILTFPTAVRLRRLVLQHNAVTPEKSVMRIVVRPMQGVAAGPPILAYPDFPAVGGGMFGRTLAGLGGTPLGDGRTMLSFPDLLGTSWLLQLAITPKDGDEVIRLSPVANVPVIESVAIAAAPRNLSLTLLGTPETPLWANADVLLPSSGEQEVSFLPIAQRRLSDALKASEASRSPGAAPPLTLPLALRFHSDSGARLEVKRLALAGEYRVRPLGEAPATLRLAARPVALVLDAPALLRPSRVQATLTARLLGRALNPGSPPGPLATPGRGLRAMPERLIAARVPVAARPGDAAGAPVPLASFALRIDTPESAEIALELRADVAGRPGAMLAPAVVRQFEAGFADWIEFELPAPLLAAPGSIVWAAIRPTKGTALWHAAPGGIGGACVSADRGASWGDAADTLGLAAPLLVQAFHVEAPPYRRPQLYLHDGTAPFGGDWLAGAAEDTPSQFRVADAALPDAVRDRLRETAPRHAGDPRGDTRILLFSATALDLVITGLTLAYDPFA
ncbi:MAG: hypothetical protein V4574_10490 [Pseudomonadota bacterium]